MLVSIVINNHNYGRFLGQAIDSALAQTHAALEVIVCDDASTDDSWEVMQRYGTRITALRLAENGGQAAAMNAGFAASCGEFVLFLDSDDLLDPSTVATCLPLFTPGVAKVQYALRCIDEAGRPTGRQVPFLMHQGDVRPVIRRFGSYAGPPSSGNFYRRSAIERYFPLREADWRRAADTPPFILAAFNGQVANAPRALGSYRLHSAANRARGCFGNIATRPSDSLRVDLHRRSASLAILERCDGLRVSGPFLPLPWNLRTRAMSWRLEPAAHPFPEDSAWSLLRLQAQSLRDCPGYTWLERRASQAWLLGILAMPGALAWRVAVTNTSARLRRWLGRLGGRHSQRTA
ncbi:MAG: glycosyltransferase [Burkholderiaceae bacterium]|nr:glycosyltransferase [Burkholderiaceae bacterium]